MEMNNSNSDSTLPKIKNSRHSKPPKLKRFFNNRNQARNTYSKRILEKSKRYYSKPVDTLATTINKSKEKHPNLVNRYLFFKPHVSASSWIAIESKTGRYLDGKDEDEVREIASLTKIMTCITAIQEIAFLRRSFEEQVRVSDVAATMEGTTAELQPGDELSLWDLLHALMLPSGNDAAMAVAEHIGKFIHQGGDAVAAFVEKMNFNAMSLDLKQMKFTNPHGMSTSLNLSTARNVALLASHCMKVPPFRKIVSTKSHECSIFNPSGIRKVEWFNTNALLEKGFCGVKTGITPAAGPCLCFCMERKKKKLLVVLLNSKSMESRWREALKLWKYASLHLLH
jgi:D-alanyl-D-alanine carboxypeptidase